MPKINRVTRIIEAEELESLRGERAEKLRELAESQDKFSETKETVNKARERLHGNGEEGDEEESPEVETPSAPVQSEDEDDESDDDEEGEDSGSDDDDDEDAGEYDGGGDDDQSSSAATDSGHDLPKRSAILQHLHEVRSETLKTALRNWYQSDGKWDITTIAAISTLVGGGQIAQAALTSAYFKTFGAKHVVVPDEHITERPGVDKIREYSRPFNEYEYLAAQGKSHEEAMQGAAQRLESLVTTDLQLAKTKSAQAIMLAENAADDSETVGDTVVAALRAVALPSDNQHITITHTRQRNRNMQRYRRVIGSDNPCPLCLLASTQVYYHEDLMPIHPGCECDVEPLDGDDDPKDIWIPQSYLDGKVAGEGSTEADSTGPGRRQRRGGNAVRANDIRYYLQKIANTYDSATHEAPGDVEVKDLDDLITVHEHGEIGPVLTYAGQHFRGPEDLPHKPSRLLSPMESPAPTPAIVAKAARAQPFKGATKPLTKAQTDVAVNKLLDDRIAELGRKSPPPGGDPVWKKVRALRESQIAPAKAAPKKVVSDKLESFAGKQAREVKEDSEFVRANGFDKSSVTQIGHYLTDTHDGLGAVEGFDAPGVNVVAAKEVLHAADDMMTKYPNVRIGKLTIEKYDTDSSAIATTWPDRFTANRTDKVSFNRRQMLQSNESNFHDVADYSEATGHFFPGFADKPWYNSFVHEFGHVMDNSGGLRARVLTNDDALNLFRRTHPEFNPVSDDYDVEKATEAYQAWELNGRVSAYSMDEGRLPGTTLSGVVGGKYSVVSGNMLDSVEAPAQAFEDVERRGADASDLSKVLHDRLVEFYKAPAVDGQTYVSNERAAQSQNTDPIQRLIEDAKSKAQQHLSDVQTAAQLNAEEVAGKGAVRIEYVRNNNGVRKNAPADAFGQDLEPWGRYMSDTQGAAPTDLPAGWERGYVTFKRPLFVDDNDGQWKQKLSAMYDGATGKQLSEKLLADGYDGVIPRDKYGNVEVVDIRPKDARGHVVTHTANGDEEHPLTRANLTLAEPPEGGEANDPLMKMLGENPTETPEEKKSDVDSIMDMLGVKDSTAKAPVPEPKVEPIPGVPPGWEQYYRDMMSREDTSGTPGVVMMSLKDIEQFREYDRGQGDDQDVVTKAIKDAATEGSPKGVIKTPIQLQVSPTGAMVAEGNHRIAAAKALKITKIPVRIKQVDKIIPNDVGSRGETPFTEKSKDLVDKAIAKVAKDADTLRKRVIRQEEDRLAAIEKAKGFGLVQARLKDGVEIKPIYAYEMVGKGKLAVPKLDKDGNKIVRMAVVKDKKTKLPVIGPDGKPLMQPVVDVKASWDSVSDDTLKENWRKAIRGSLPWAQEAGKVWYPEVNRWANFMIGKYGQQFEDTWGKKLTPDLMASFIASYSENNSWAGNLLGIRKFLDGTGSRPVEVNASTLKDFDVDAARKTKFKNPDGSAWDFHVAKAFRAMQNPEGGVADLRKYAADSPKPADFAANVAGDYSKATADRWVARIMLHASDYEFADAMWQASQTVNKVTDRYGYKRLSGALQAVAAEPEFSYLGNAAAVQAVPWVQVVGPLGSIGYVEDLENFASIAAETNRRAAGFGDVK